MSEKLFGKTQILRIELLLVVDSVMQIDADDAVSLEAEYDITHAGDECEGGFLAELGCLHSILDRR